MRIACFSANYLPSLDAEALVTSKWVCAMRQRGFTIDVFSAKPDGGERNIDFSYVSNFIHSLKNRSFEITKFGEINNYLQFAIEDFSKKHSYDKYDLIVSRYEPISSAIAAYILHKKYQIPWIANYNDPIPREIYIRKSFFGLIDLERKIFQENWFHRLLMTPASVVFPCERLSKFVMANLQNRFHKRELENGRDNIFIIPHIGGHVDYEHDSADTAMYSAAGNRSINEDVILIRHIGYLSIKRDITSFLLALDLWEKQEHKIKIRVEFIGNNKGQESKLQYFKQQERKLIRVADIGIVSNRKSYSLMFEADILLIIEEPRKENIHLPSKFCDYSMIGRPILAITSKNSTIADYLSDYGGGIVVEHGDISGIVNAIKLLTTRRKLSEKLDEQFSKYTITQKWVSLIESVSL